MKKLLIILLFLSMLFYSGFSNDQTAEQGTYITVYVEGLGYIVVYCDSDGDWETPGTGSNPNG